MQLHSAGDSTGLEGPKWLQSHLVAGAGWQLGHLSSPPGGLPSYSGFQITWQSWSSVLREWTEKLEDLLRPKLGNLCNIISTTFCSSEQATSLAQIQGSGETFYLWLGTVQNHIAKEFTEWKGRNLWPLTNLPFFGGTPILIKIIHSINHAHVHDQFLKLYSFPCSGWAWNISRKFTLENIWIANKHMKICLTSLTLRKCK